MAKYLLAVIIGYFVGSISFAYVISKKLYSLDIRQYGSKNPGSTNVLRVLGVKPALRVFAADFLKGFIVVMLARYLGGYKVAMVAGISVIIGHDWSIFLKFNGGKGIATSLGVVMGIVPYIGIWLVVICITVIGIFRYVSLGSITGAILLPIFLAIFKYPVEYILFGIAAGAMAVYRHRSNIQRLFSGTENRLGQKVKR